MQNKPLLIGLAVLVAAGGITAIAMAKQNNNNHLPTENAKKQAMMKKEEGAMMDQEKDKMMADDSKVLGVVMSSGKLMTLWPGDELAMLSHDVTLKDGAKVTRNGNITASNGTVISLKDGQELTTDGAILTVDIFKMTIMKEEGMTKDSNTSADIYAQRRSHDERVC